MNQNPNNCFGFLKNFVSRGILICYEIYGSLELISRITRGSQKRLCETLAKDLNVIGLNPALFVILFYNLIDLFLNNQKFNG